MNNYELLYILPANITGEEIKTAFLEIEKNILKMGGKKLETLLNHPFLVKAETSKEEDVEELKNLPIVKRRLAYPIKKNRVGYYCLFNFSSEPGKVKKIDSYLRMNNIVIRHLIIQASPMTKDEIQLLEKLFARKRAEQEKQEKEKKEKSKPKEGRKEIKKEETAVLKRQKLEPVGKEEIKKTEEAVKAEKKKEEGVAGEVEKKQKEIKEDEVEKKKEDKERKTTVKKKKIKLEDLEEKLDEILEDTSIV